MIQELLGYTKLDNFLNVVSKAKAAGEVSGHPEEQISLNRLVSAKLALRA